MREEPGEQRFENLSRVWKGTSRSEEHTGEGQAVSLTTQFSFPEKEAAASRPSPRIQDVPAESVNRGLFPSGGHDLFPEN